MGRKRARPRDSNSPDRDKPLRRSARLAGLSRREEETQTATQNLALPAVQPEQESSFAMKLVIQPPERVAVGVAFGTPLVVTFTASSPTREDLQAPSAMCDISGVWAYLSLMSEDLTQSLAPPNADLLQGQTVDSIHPVTRAQDGSIQTVGYATFANIVVSEPGRYCLRVTIIDMNDMLVEQPAEGGKVLPSLHSAPFDVVPHVEGNQSYSENNSETVARLREIGIEL